MNTENPLKDLEEEFNKIILLNKKEKTHKKTNKHTNQEDVINLHQLFLKLKREKAQKNCNKSML